MARAVEGVAGSLLRVAEHDVVELLGIDSRALDRALSRDCAQFLRGEIFQFAAVAPHGRTRAADDRNVTGFQHEILIERGQMLERKLISVAKSCELRILRFGLNGSRHRIAVLWLLGSGSF